MATLPYPQRTTSPTTLDLKPVQQTGMSAYDGGPGSSVSWNSGGTQYTRTPDQSGREMDAATHASNLRIKQMQESARLQDQRMKALMAATSGGATTAPSADGSGIGANEEAARAAAFGRAKDQAGQTALASLQALQNVMSQRGMRGSTVEGDATSEVILGGGNKVNEFTREQLMQDLNRAAEVSDRNYAGGIQMRGQDMSKFQSLLGLISSTGGAY